MSLLSLARLYKPYFPAKTVSSSSVRINEKVLQSTLFGQLRLYNYIKVKLFGNKYTRTKQPKATKNLNKNAKNTNKNSNKNATYKQKLNQLKFEESNSQKGQKTTNQPTKTFFNSNLKLCRHFKGNRSALKKAL